MDCLVPGIGEIIGGSQREENYEVLTKRMEELGLNEKDYQFYLDLRKYGTARDVYKRQTTFCKPNKQTRNPIIITTTVQKIISEGTEFI